METERVTVTAGVPTIWMGMLPLLDGPRPVRAAHDHLRRVGRAAGAVRGVAREDRHADHPGVGDDRDSRRSASVCHVRSEFADADEDAQADVRATGGDRPARGRAAHRRLRDPRAAAVGRRRRPASSSAAGRGSPSSTSAPTNRASSSPPTAGCAPATSRRISPLGYVRLVDRTKDLVKSGGEWISSVDLENTIMGHPKVAEAAVIAVPHPKWSERPLACVVVKRRRGADPRGGPRVPAPRADASGSCPTTSCSSTRCRRPASASSPRRRCGTSSRDYELPTAGQ